MTMATETENNGPAAEAKDIKEMKDALKDDAPMMDNKKDEASKETSATEKKEESSEKKIEGDGTTAATGNAAAGGDAATAAAATTTAQAKAPGVHKANFEKDIVYLYQFPRTPLLPSLSSYCLKVETWLRLNGVKYEVCDMGF